MSLKIAPIPRDELAAQIDALARLRIEVFRAWPYLYDGDMAYEAAYLRPYTEGNESLVVGAWDGDQLVGAATGAPLEHHAEAFGAPFAAIGLPLHAVFYCAESVLLPAYRGQGAGHAFFDHRESHARALGRTHTAFCAVVRADDHPDRPADYAPLDPFWLKRGYRPVEGAVAYFPWRDIGAAAETEKPMQFWLREL